MNCKKILKNPKNIWILLGLIALLFRFALAAESIEQYYSQGLFRYVRLGFDSLAGVFPFAVVYVLFSIVVICLVRKLLKFYKLKLGWKAKTLRVLHSLASFSGLIIFFFLLLWGFNYGRVPLEDKMAIDPQPLDLAQLHDELERSTVEVNRLRNLLPGITDSTVSETFLPDDLELVMRKELIKTLDTYGYSAYDRVRVRMLYPKGILLRISTAGIYIPFTGEGHVDPGLHHLQIPFVVVHEMSHAMGFGDEGTCNFLAYLACRQSENIYLNYVGELYYWRYVAADYQFYKPNEFEEFWRQLPKGMLNDLLSIRRAIERYPDIFPQIRDIAYNAYLHSQGISDGIKNYDRVIMMVHAWLAKQEVEQGVN